MELVVESQARKKTLVIILHSFYDEIMLYSTYSKVNCVAPTEANCYAACTPKSYSTLQKRAHVRLNNEKSGARLDFMHAPPIHIETIACL